MNKAFVIFSAILLIVFSGASQALIAENNSLPSPLKKLLQGSTTQSISQSATSGSQAKSQANSQANSQDSSAAHTRSVWQGADLDTLFTQSAIELFKARPVSATTYGLDESLAGGAYNDRLDDYSPKAEGALRATLRELNQVLKDYPATDAQGRENQGRENLAQENRVVMMDINNYFAGDPDFSIGYIDTWMGLSAFIVNQINGPLIDVPNTLTTSHKIESLADVKDYLSRLIKFRQFADSVQQKVAADAAQGWIPPKAIIRKTISGLNNFIQPEVKQHPLFTYLSTELDSLDNVSAAYKEESLRAAERTIHTVVYPAYRKMIATQQSLLDKATGESGIWAQPNGVEFYKNAVKVLGDTDLSPEQIHQLGLAEVARISTEMDVIFKTQGMRAGTVGERMSALNDDPQFLYEDSDAGRAQLLNDLNGYINEITARMPSQFASVPPYDVEVRRIPVTIEEGAAGGQYSSPSIDGSQPGIYWINLRDMKANPKFDLKTLTYHEANPGHHWQVALNLAQEDLPMLRRIAPYNAYTEGWALYSEKVAKELGMYKDDPFGDLGRLKAELFRAVRLVVDTGLHYKKWSREEAIKYMAETTGTVESDVVAEIERYMVWPGQALGYKMGMINILKQREIAKQALGDKFDIKAFHDLVLLGGAVPMAVLDKKVADWVDGQR